MDVTRKPQALKMKPTLLATTPLPMPLMTPPEIRTYFMAATYLKLILIQVLLDTST
jgi:hypothetical protein